MLELDFFFLNVLYFCKDLLQIGRVYWLQQQLKLCFVKALLSYPLALPQCNEQNVAVSHIVSSPLKLGEGGSFLFWAKRGIMKKLLRNRGLVERWGSSQKGGGFQIVSSVFLQKSIFSLLLGFFCLVNIHTCCNQQIYSFIWFSFYQKMIYYKISFPLTLIFNYNFVKISLLMMVISISISNIFENKSQVFERSD